ncbi:hypothetical protein ANOM_001347 [Aspergillus nomiae NRRL 13137]|uniref:Uncharacterized protein n=1 Tax=Aspergillus nomiae NRRL (strain ATCC 15546 / NRRL 13137 / CBS 260.88 / M93) TaxID=1509407 RepID=A0A0L1JFU8_ASPN3|nr:uncharacterized protein ANOM_001347 [Aspergillus nomiae NRRL 13137]KNG90621.1 hypothetical protein ANOM_001347 [Aspergillus nomiae NRRL 13137]
MAPSEYSIRLQKGITGGFAPPTPSAILQLVKSAGDSNIIISEAVRPDGQPGLQQQPEKTLDASDGEAESLVTELYEILKDLPLEIPPGSEDIYRMDTSIAWGSEDLVWHNGGPQGCVRATSDVQPSETERAGFRRAVDIVWELVGMANP